MCITHWDELLHRQKHGTCNELNTYKRESQRIDYILCASELASFIRHCDILLFDMITTSNHIEACS